MWTMGLERVLCNRLKKWDYWKNVLTFIDLDVFFYHKSYLGYFLKGGGRGWKQTTGRGKDRERGRGEKNNLHGVVCVEVLTPVQSRQLFSEKRDWLLSRRLPWETEERKHIGAPSGRAQNVSAGHLQFLLLEEETLYHLPSKEKQMLVIKHSNDVHFAQKGW